MREKSPRGTLLKSLGFQRNFPIDKFQLFFQIEIQFSPFKFVLRAIKYIWKAILIWEELLLVGLKKYRVDHFIVLSVQH